MEKTTTPEVLFLTKYIELFELFSVIDYFVMDE